MATIGILGAGAEGSGFGALVARELGSSEIHLADVSAKALDLAATRVSSVNGTKVVPTTLDASHSDAVAGWAQGLDVVLNATLPEFNQAVMRGCLRAGTHYVDMNSGPFEMEGLIPPEHTIDAQLALDEEFRSAGLAAVLCAGVAPGWVDLAARSMIEELDDVESITVRWVDWSDAKTLVSTVGPGLIANFNMPTPMRWEDGEARAVDLFESEELYDWPEPIGSVPVFTGFLHPEMRSLRELGATPRRIEVKSGLACGRWRSSRDIWIEAVRRQLDAGAAVDEADLPRRLGASFIGPETFEDALASGVVSDGAFVAAVQVHGRVGERTVDRTMMLKVDLATARTYIPWGTHMVYATIGTTPICLIPRLVDGTVTQRGVFTVGAMDQWRDILDAVVARGHVITDRLLEQGPIAGFGTAVA